jgi:hypothetical protein
MVSAILTCPPDSEMELRIPEVLQFLVGISDKCPGAIASNKAKCRPSSDVAGTTVTRVTIHFIDLAKFWPLCCRKGSIVGCLRHPEPRKVNEIALTDLRVKQALYQLSYDPDTCEFNRLHQQFFVLVRKLNLRVVPVTRPAVA